MDELIQDPWWQHEFSPPKAGESRNHVSRDGRIVVKVLNAQQGARGLYSGATQLALLLADRPEIEKACLVLAVVRLSMDHLRREWANIKSSFPPTMSGRLSLIAIGKDDVWVESDEAPFRRIANVFQAVRGDALDGDALDGDTLDGDTSDGDTSDGDTLDGDTLDGDTLDGDTLDGDTLDGDTLDGDTLDGDTLDTVPVIARQKQLEVLKVLIRRWLLRKGPVPIGKLTEQVGCTYPTVKKALGKLEQKRSIIRNVNRSVELARFPMSSWQELLAPSGNLRRSYHYRGASGEKPDSERLLNQLEQMKPPGVAVGGVAAAYHWRPDLDLHGSFPLDILLHAHENTVDLGFVKKLDPALSRIDDRYESPVLVVRLLQRGDPFFEHSPGTNLPFADPVETAMDLHDLGLTAQASLLFAHFRHELRLHRRNSTR